MLVLVRGWVVPGGWRLQVSRNWVPSTTTSAATPVKDPKKVERCHLDFIHHHIEEAVCDCRVRIFSYHTLARGTKNSAHTEGQVLGMNLSSRERHEDPSICLRAVETITRKPAVTIPTTACQ